MSSKTVLELKQSPAVFQCRLKAQKKVSGKYHTTLCSFNIKNLFGFVRCLCGWLEMCTTEIPIYLDNFLQSCRFSFLASSPFWLWWCSVWIMLVFCSTWCIETGISYPTDHQNEFAWTNYKFYIKEKLTDFLYISLIIAFFKWSRYALIIKSK